MLNKITIATRSSRLAIAQANLVIEALKSASPNTEFVLKSISTTGDIRLEDNLSLIGGKGLFLKEIEQSLLTKECDIAVHSMKDVPVKLPEGLIIPSVIKRGDPRDALLSPEGFSIDTLPYGSSIGTCAPRRTEILKTLRPDVKILPIRGNIESRINKLKSGQYDSIVLALCGLKRAHIKSVAYHALPLTTMVPAIGQGTIGIECRKEDINIINLLKSVNHAETFLYTKIERDFMEKVGASCTTPIGGYAHHKNGKLNLLTYYKLEKKGSKELMTFEGKAESLGTQAANYYFSQGIKQPL